MATTSLISIDRYLATTYRPDCDYIDGEVRERNVGKFDHSNLQGVLIGTLFLHALEWNIRALPEQRVRVGPARVRVPDICIVFRDEQADQVLSRPPLVCVEILSEGDTLRTTQPRLIDYEAFGVKHIWILDPTERKAWTFREGEFLDAAESLSVPGTPISIHLPVLYSQLD